MGGRKSAMTVAFNASVAPDFRIRKKTLWLAALLPMLFVSDILYGAMEIAGAKAVLTPGVILRGMVVLAAVFMVLRHWKLVGSQLFIWILIIMISILPSVIVSIFHSQDFLFDLSVLAKALYFPLVSGLFVVLVRRYCIDGDTVLRYIEYAAYMLGLSLLLSQMAGFEKKTYGDYAFGSTGIFYAQNDLTLAFGLALLAGGYRLVMLRFSWIRAFLMGLSAFACVQIGTRASLAVVVGVALTAVACILWGREVTKANRMSARLRRWVTGVFVFAVMLSMLAYGWSMQQEFSYQQKKIEEIIEGKFPRLLLVLAGLRHIEERNDWFNIFGEGADAFQRGVAEYFPSQEDRKMVEVDWLDLFGSYGVFFTLLIHAFVLFALFMNSYGFLVKRDPLSGLIAAAALLYFMHGALAGHALTTPIPSTVAAAYFAISFGTRMIQREVYLAHDGWLYCHYYRN